MLPSAVVRGRRNPLHFGFSMRLARARKAAGMSGSALSLAVGMTADAAWRLEAGDRVPRVDTVEKLARVLYLSPCLLAFGLEQSCEHVAGSLCAGLPARVLQLRQERGISRRELGRLSGTSHNFVHTTETGATVPTIAKIEQLANALGVSACWLAYGVGDRELSTRRRSASAARSQDPIA
jgi:transcriptional regulator with XRE-family HTH domain